METMTVEPGATTGNYVTLEPQSVSRTSRWINISNLHSVVIGAMFSISAIELLRSQSFTRKISVRQKKALTIDDLGWTREQAAQIRGRLASFAQGWDDPSMDVYDQD